MFRVTKYDWQTLWKRVGKEAFGSSANAIRGFGRRNSSASTGPLPEVFSPVMTVSVFFAKLCLSLKHPGGGPLEPAPGEELNDYRW